MKKRILLTLIFSLFIGVKGAYATSVSISVSPATTVVGNSGTATITVSADGGIIGQIYGTFSCGGLGSKDLQYINSNGEKTTSKSYTINWKASSTGTYTCFASELSVGLLNDPEAGVRSVNVSGTSKTITIVGSSGGSSSGGSSGGSSNSNGGTTGSKKTYSTNNNLKSLEVEGFKLTPDFSKDKLEYSLEVPNETAKVNIKATPEDDKATIKGTGEVKVTEGKNKLEVKVIAENGNEKVYIINLTVKELDPIEVKVGNKKLTIVRKDESLTPPDNYEKSTIKIGKDEVLCFRNNVTKNILIALKDDKGKIEFYSYDQKKNTYTLYNGHKIGNISLNILDMPKDKIPSGYLKTSFTYDKSKITGYQYVEDGVTYAADSSVKGNDFYLIYAVNEVTGKKGLYMYDKLENTIQRYNSNLFLTYQNKADSYFLYFLISLLVLAISIVTFTIILIKKKKHKTKFA